MSRNDDSDEFDDPRNSSGIISSLYGVLNRRERVEPRGRLRVFLPVGAMLAVFAAVLWYSYPRAEVSRDLLTVPVIKAEQTSYKTIPADRGGMDIPHKDSTVFEAIRESDGNGAGRIENLLPEAEEPVSREQLFAGLKTDIEDAPEAVPAAAGTPEEAPAEKPAPAAEATTTADAGGVEELDEASSAAEPPAELPMPEPVKTAAAPAAPVPPSAPAAAEKKASESATAEKPTTAAVSDKETELAKTEPAAGTPAEHYVQLGSLRTQQDAEKAWKTFQAGFPAQLNGLDMRVQKADLGDKGTFYRVQGGPLAEAKAKDICQAMAKQKPGSCLVVHR